MTTTPNAPNLIHGGIVLIDPATSAVKRIVALQYNPHTLTRSLQVRGTGAEGGDRSEVLRLKGPPVETIKLEAELDAVDQLEFAPNSASEVGIFPQLAALETLIYPTSTQLITNHTLERSGTLEILPMETPLALFVWSSQRIVPVRVTEFSITEEAFDANLHPIQAKVSLGLRVLTIDDAGFSHKAGSLFMTYLQQKERLAGSNPGAGLNALGIAGIP